MSPVTIIILALIVLFAVMVFLLKDAEKIHEKLNTLKKRAKQAKTRDELDAVWEDLKEVNKKCWHQSFAPKIIEIRTIIETKNDLFP